MAKCGICMTAFKGFVLKKQTKLEGACIRYVCIRNKCIVCVHIYVHIREILCNSTVCIWEKQKLAGPKNKHLHVINLW